MSLYGNVKKIGSATFQFDRIYHSRTEMDLAAAKDGVYAGRYVLVEYGERFENLPITEEIQDALNYLSQHQNSMTSENWTEFFQNYKHIGLSDPQAQADFMIATYSDQELYLTQLSQKLSNRLETITSDLPSSVIDYLGQSNIYLRIDPDTGVQTQVIERDEFLNSEKLDLQNYGSTYDSTVWQKIYIQSQDRYVMVAELNAMAPKLEVEEKAPLTYELMPTDGISISSTTEPLNDELIVTGKEDENGNFEIVKLLNATEIYNKSYFDTTIDTELRYLLHQPRVIQVEAGDNTINFNRNGFNMIFSYGEKDGPSTISLIPKGLTDYTVITDPYTGDPLKDSNGIPVANLNKTTDINGKMLYMNFPSFGNAMNTIYDLLYGFPDGTEEELSHGVMRPYFRQFLRDFKYSVYATVYDENAVDENGQPSPGQVFIKIGGNKIEIKSPVEKQNENGEWELVTIEPPVDYNSLYNKSIEPSFIEAKWYNTKKEPIEFHNLDDDGENNERIDQANDIKYVLVNTRIKDSNGNLTKDSIYTFTMHLPTGDDPGQNFLIAPELKKLVQINATGLAGILSNLFGDKDPITGTTRYYLYNDWTADSSGKTNVPTILNKPYTVGGYEETATTRKEDLYLLDGRDLEHVIINEGSEEEEHGPSAKRSAGSIINKHYYIENILSNNFSGGHYKIDFDTWQLKSVTSQEESSIITD